MGRRHPAVVDVWRRARQEFTPFLDLPAEIRRVVYITRSNR
jgi:putative transposase